MAADIGRAGLADPMRVDEDEQGDPREPEEEPRRPREAAAPRRFGGDGSIALALDGGADRLGRGGRGVIDDRHPFGRIIGLHRGDAGELAHGRLYGVLAAVAMHSACAKTQAAARAETQAASRAQAAARLAHSPLSFSNQSVRAQAREMAAATREAATFCLGRGPSRPASATV